MAELEKLLCTDSKVESLKKINAIIEKGGGGGLEIGDIGFTQMSIDETKGKRRVLNGQLIIQEQYVQFTNIIKATQTLNPDLFCTEAEWQAEVTMSTNGVCYKYVIDDEVGTIRLPKYPTYLDLSINGAKKVSVYGTGKALSITNGGSYTTGCLAFYDSDSNEKVLAYRTGGNSALPSNASYSSGNLFGNGNKIGVSTDGTKSGLTGSVTTESEQIKGTYFIQVATGAETEDNIINEIELNNPFSLLDYKYSEYELNNLSWLRSEGQYNSKAIYPAVYDLLLKIYNGAETKAGVSVKLTSETFTDTDFVLNTNDETFRLPVKVKLASGKAVVGNGLALGLTNGSDNFGLAQRHGASNAKLFTCAMEDVYGSSVSSNPPDIDHPQAGILGITTDANYSGIETSDSDLYLYFYVGETVQNANLINAGRIEEIKANKKDVDGQWISKELIVSEAIAIGDYTLDLSDYLPNDGYMYEVWGHVYLSRGGDSGTNTNVYIYDGFGERGRIAHTMADGANFQQNSNGFLLTVDTERKMRVEITTLAAAACVVYLFKYRRLGTNQ